MPTERSTKHDYTIHFVTHGINYATVKQVDCIHRFYLHNLLCVCYTTVLNYLLLTSLKYNDRFNEQHKVSNKLLMYIFCILKSNISIRKQTKCYVYDITDSGFGAINFSNRYLPNIQMVQTVQSQDFGLFRLLIRNLIRNQLALITTRNKNEPNFNSVIFLNIYINLAYRNLISSVTVI